MANRTLALIRLLYNEGMVREFPGVTMNPAHKLEPPGEEHGRDRYLTTTEIKAVWDATAWETPIMKVIFRVTLLTAQRVGSVCAMRWADIDDADVWRIPPERFKGRRPHMVPLSDEVLDVLAELRPLTGGGAYVFPSRFPEDGEKHKPYIASTNKALQRIRDRTDIPLWTVHDFRTTFRTHATRPEKPGDKRDPAGLGVAPTIADAVLGHKEASLGFDRYTAEPERYLLSEKRDALARWGRFVLAAVADQEGKC
jgi:integrase